MVYRSCVAQFAYFSSKYVNNRSCSTRQTALPAPPPEAVPGADIPPPPPVVGLGGGEGGGDGGGGGPGGGSGELGPLPSPGAAKDKVKQ